VASAPASGLGVFEPARGRVVFVAGGRLEAVDPLDPSSSVAIEPVGLDLGAETMPAGWSADGSKLALTIEEGGVLYVMDAAGSLDRVAIEELPDVEFGCCSFTTSSWLSPDGTQGLAFAHGDQVGLDRGKLYLVDLDDVGRSRAVRVDDFEWAPGAFSQDPMPAWSPDGSQVAYVWSKDGDLATPAIGIVDLATETSRELTSGWGLVRQLAWSPDGSQLLVAAAEDAPGFGGALNPLTQPRQASLYVVDIDDAETQEIALGHYVAAAWSPDGSQIAAIDYSGSRKVVVLDTDGTADRRILAELPAGDLFTGVAWHPIPSAPE
jgi:Tol biopolymer transport system component